MSGKTWGRLSISPDGNLLAYPCNTDEPDAVRKLTVIRQAPVLLSSRSLSPKMRQNFIGPPAAEPSSTCG